MQKTKLTYAKFQNMFLSKICHNENKNVKIYIKWNVSSHLIKIYAVCKSLARNVINRRLATCMAIVVDKQLAR